MTMPTRLADARRAAAFQLNTLHATDALAAERFEGAHPWPPNAGVITRWENFNVSSYRHALTAKLKHV
jgi:hypothetical protein